MDSSKNSYFYDDKNTFQQDKSTNDSSKCASFSKLTKNSTYITSNSSLLQKNYGLGSGLNKNEIEKKTTHTPIYIQNTLNKMNNDYLNCTMKKVLSRYPSKNKLSNDSDCESDDTVDNEETNLRLFIKKTKQGDYCLGSKYIKSNNSNHSDFKKDIKEKRTDNINSGLVLKSEDPLNSSTYISNSSYSPNNKLDKNTKLHSYNKNLIFEVKSIENKKVNFDFYDFYDNCTVFNNKKNDQVMIKQSKKFQKISLRIVMIEKKYSIPKEKNSKDSVSLIINKQQNCLDKKESNKLVLKKTNECKSSNELVSLNSTSVDKYKNKYQIIDSQSKNIINLSLNEENKLSLLSANEESSFNSMSSKKSDNYKNIVDNNIDSKEYVEILTINYENQLNSYYLEKAKDLPLFEEVKSDFPIDNYKLNSIEEVYSLISSLHHKNNNINEIYDISSNINKNYNYYINKGVNILVNNNYYSIVTFIVNNSVILVIKKLTSLDYINDIKNSKLMPLINKYKNNKYNYTISSFETVGLEQHISSNNYCSNDLKNSNIIFNTNNNYHNYKFNKDTYTASYLNSKAEDQNYSYRLGNYYSPEMFNNDYKDGNRNNSDNSSFYDESYSNNNMNNDFDINKANDMIIINSKEIQKITIINNRNYTSQDNELVISTKPENSCISSDNSHRNHDNFLQIFNNIDELNITNKTINDEIPDNESPVNNISCCFLFDEKANTWNFKFNECNNSSVWKKTNSDKIYLTPFNQESNLYNKSSEGNRNNISYISNSLSKNLSSKKTEANSYDKQPQSAYYYKTPFFNESLCFEAVDYFL